jgi:1-acyl-sn-glycerol-3-phosphate acyltransferase
MDNEKFIDVRKIIQSKNSTLYRWMPRFIIRYLERILHQKEINKFLIDNKDVYNIEFCEQVIKLLNVQIDFIGLEKIPKTGKIVLAMNHPLGGMDAMALASALKGHREDLKFIVNDILLNLKNLNGIFIGVDKHGKNSLSKREQLANLFSMDEAVCIFPAGLVSRKINGEVMDLEWKKTFITMSKKHQRTIIPIYIDGKLSNFFYRLSNFRKKIGIKANIEMLYLSNEFFKLQDKHIRIIVGEPIPFDSLPQELNERKQAFWVKDKVYELRKHSL